MNSDQTIGRAEALRRAMLASAAAEFHGAAGGV